MCSHSISYIPDHWLHGKAILFKKESAMGFAEVLEEFVAGIGWTDKVEQDGDISRIAVKLSIGGSSYRLMIEGYDSRQWVVLHLYPVYSVNAGKSVDACMFFNYVNNTFSYPGSVSVDDEGVICYRQIIDVEGLNADASLINNMLNAAADLFERNGEMIETIAQGDDRYEDVRKQLEQAMR